MAPEPGEHPVVVQPLMGEPVVQYGVKELLADINQRQIEGFASVKTSLSENVAAINMRIDRIESDVRQLQDRQRVDEAAASQAARLRASSIAWWKWMIGAVISVGLLVAAILPNLR